MSPQAPTLPRLDLAPRLKRPLSFWNPLDYLRLLYWAWFFPQALRWYVDTFGSGYIPPEKAAWCKGWPILRNSPVERRLLVQTFILTILIPLIVAGGLSQLGFPVQWLWLVWGILGGVAFSLLVSLFGNVAGGVIAGLWMSAGVSIWAILPEGIGYNTSSFSALAVIGGYILGVTANSFNVMAGGVVVLQVVSVFTCAFPSVLMAFVFSSLFIVIPGLVFGAGWLLGGVSGTELVAVIGSGFKLIRNFHLDYLILMEVIILRPDAWLFYTVVSRKRMPRSPGQIPHGTLFPLPTLSHQLQQQLRQNWEVGLHNSDQLLRYSAQCIAVLQAVKAVLAESDAEQVVWRVARLTDRPFDWRFIALVSVPLWPQLRATFRNALRRIWKEFQNWGEFNSEPFNLQITEPPRLDTFPRATCAGFWYLHQQQPTEAARAFQTVRHLLYGEEMYTIAYNLHLCKDATDLETIATLNLYSSPESDPHKCLRSTTWDTIAIFKRVIQDAQLSQRSTDEQIRAQALTHAQQLLQKIAAHSEALPSAEQDLIVAIAQQWQDGLMMATDGMAIAGVTGD